MCKTPFGSQGVILDVVKQIIFALMAKVMKFFGIPSLNHSATFFRLWLYRSTIFLGGFQRTKTLNDNFGLFVFNDY